MLKLRASQAFSMLRVSFLGSIQGSARHLCASFVPGKAGLGCGFWRVRLLAVQGCRS